MRVYRIEHGEHRQGPWSGGAGLFTDSKGHNPSAGPAWYDEGFTVGLLAERWKTYLHKATLVRQWFSEEHLEALELAGYVLAIYDISEEYLQRGRIGWQCIGLWEHAKHVDDISVWQYSVAA